MTTITTLPLNSLAVSPHNVRKSHSKTSFEELKASILAHGLLNNLVVTRADNGKYFVIAGARRLTVLQALNKDGKFPGGCMVPCHITDDPDDAAELSLAENTVREAMHPMDEFEAFEALAKDHDPLEIAKRFGVTEAHVRKRLRLGGVAKEIRDAYRAEKMNLECVMAFTLTDDHAVQRKIYKAVKDNPHAHAIRRLLTERKVGSRDRLARFVGLEAYEKAGGKITGDLFNAEQFLDDPVLLQELAAGKLKALEEKLKAEGWEWVHVALKDEYGFTHKYGRIHPKEVPPPKELVQKHAKLAKECDGLENQLRDMDDGDPRYAELDARSDELVLQLEALEVELDGYNKFNPEQMKTAGVYARLDHDGKLLIDRGLVSRATEKKLEAAKTGKKPEPEEKGFSQSLIMSLKAFRLQVAEVAIASKPELAYDLLVFSASLSLIGKKFHTKGFDISFRDKRPMMGEVKGTAAATELVAIAEKLPLEWLKLKTEAEQFDAFQKLKPPQKASILAYCVALTLQPELAPAPDDAITAYDAVLAQSDVKVADYWRPTKDNFLSRITREQLVEIGKSRLSPAWAGSRGLLKKSGFAEELHKLFANPKSNPIGPGTAEAIANYLPEGMAFTLPEKKPAKAKKKAA